VLVTEADPEGAIAGVVIAATSDNNRSDDTFDFAQLTTERTVAVQDDGLLLPAVQTGGVSVASGDVNGDTDALGDPITFTFTVTNTSSAYEGSHALYQDVIVPTLDAGTLFIPPDGYWY